MSDSSLDRLFDRFNEFSVGFGPIFRDFNHALGNYPPHSIIHISDNEFHLELAVAGFKKNEVIITEDNSLLTVSAQRESSPESTYQYRGLAKRAFSKSFQIAEYFEVSEAKLEDGILTIKFIKNPPIDNSRTIAIQ